MDQVAPGGGQDDDPTRPEVLAAIANSLWTLFRQCLMTSGPLRVDKCFIVLEHFTLIHAASMVEKIGGTRAEKEDNLRSTLARMGENVLVRYREALDAAEQETLAEATTTEKQANATGTRTLQ